MGIFKLKSLLTYLIEGLKVKYIIKVIFEPEMEAHGEHAHFHDTTLIYDNGLDSLEKAQETVVSLFKGKVIEISKGGTDIIDYKPVSKIQRVQIIKIEDENKENKELIT